MIPRLQMNKSECWSGPRALPPDGMSERRWYAVFTFPQNEKSAMRQIELRQVEAFLPTYETVKIWKNRQRVKTVMPLFPTYLFVNIEKSERAKVLESPGVIRIVGNTRQDASVAASEIELLRSSVQQGNVEPYRELASRQDSSYQEGSYGGR